MITSLIAGLGLGLSLIVAIGAQNLFVLRQGARREHVFLVATICAVSDVILILLGVSGIGLILKAAPGMIDVIRILGCVFLVGYGVMAARRAWRPSAEGLTTTGSPVAAESTGNAGSGTGATVVVTKPRVRGVILTCLALTWLNPHVYLDTVFLLGSVAATYGDERWWFAAGAVIGSLVWFFSLAYGARYAGRWLSSPRAWRALDAIIAVTMIALGASLVI